MTGLILAVVTTGVEDVTNRMGGATVAPILKAGQIVGIAKHMLAMTPTPIAVG